MRLLKFALWTLLAGLYFVPAQAIAAPAYSCSVAEIFEMHRHCRLSAGLGGASQPPALRHAECQGEEVVLRPVRWGGAIRTRGCL